MAGGTGRITIPEHAGQVPKVCQHHTKEQRHNKLQHRKRIKSQKKRTWHSQVPKTDPRTTLQKNKEHRPEV